MEWPYDTTEETPEPRRPYPLPHRLRHGADQHRPLTLLLPRGAALTRGLVPPEPFPECRPPLPGLCTPRPPFDCAERAPRLALMTKEAAIPCWPHSKRSPAMTTLPQSHDATALAEALAQRCARPPCTATPGTPVVPAHDDTHPSLSITAGAGKSCHCFAGCTARGHCRRPGADAGRFVCGDAPRMATSAS